MGIAIANRKNRCDFGALSFRVVKTVLLANGHFSGVTSAIFVIFVDFRGLRSKIPCFCGENAISESSPIFVKTTCFGQGTKRLFSKTTVSTTPKVDSGHGMTPFCMPA